ncbi:TPA_asm: hypothetical protein GZN79_05555, partial [Listeria monocytogenes]|nr:hypothetical protein [Listeria monocytogenes]
EKIDRDIFFRETSKCTTSNAFFDVITFNYTSIIDKCLEPLMRKNLIGKRKNLIQLEPVLSEVLIIFMEHCIST